MRRQSDKVMEPDWADELKAMNEDLSQENIQVVRVNDLVGPVELAAKPGSHQHAGTGTEFLVHDHEGGLSAHPHYEGQELVYPVSGYRLPSGLGDGETELLPSKADRLRERELYDQDEAQWRAMGAWIERHQHEVRELAIEGAREYGEQDFHLMAAVSAVMDGQPVQVENKEQLVRLQKEMVRYISGKIGRIASALGRGEVPSSDNWRDIEVYAFIAQKFEQTGGWIG